MKHSKLAPYAAHIAADLAAGKTKAQIARELSVSRKTLTDFIDGGLPETAPPEVQPMGVTELEILQSEIQQLRAALGKQHKGQVADERVLRAIESALGTVPPVRPLGISQPKAADDAHHRHLLMLSDFHGGEVVDPETVNGLNRYDWDIQGQRVAELLRGVLSHKRRSPELTGLDIGFIGDMCSGANHDEITISNEFALAEQGVRIGYLMADVIGALAEHYADVRVFVVEGNHPRLTRKPAAKDPHNNMDWVAAILAREATKAVGNISQFEIGRGSLFWDIAGLSYYVFHGDGIRSSMPGVPWGGVMRRTNEIRRSYAKRKIDGFMLGHYHQANAMVDLGIYMNGSLKGCDEWTLKNFGGGARPCQLLLEFDEKRSRATGVKYLTPTAGLDG